jgi:ribokinase
LPPDRPRVTVVGSINLDLVATVVSLPDPGETVTSTRLSYVPGGKGANQAVAAARLGADVRMVGAVGDDDFGEQAVAGLRGAGVDLSRVQVVHSTTGIALIFVDENGENQIVVVPGANHALDPGHVEIGEPKALVSQLEVKDEAILAALDGFDGLFCLNAAPAREVPAAILERADLIVANSLELEALGSSPMGTLFALTLGAEGALLLDDGVEVARAAPPEVDSVDGTAAGDAFTACLVVSLLEGRDREEALGRACAAGAIAASRPGAQPSLPTAAEVDEILTA